MNKYNQVMENVKITPEMKKRVLANAEGRYGRQRSRRMITNISVVAAAAAVLLLAVILPNVLNKNNPPVDYVGYNPVEYGSAQELSEAAGFEIKLPETLTFEPEETVYTLISEGFAQISYYSGDN